MEKANLFKEYSRWKKNRMMLAHELVRFEGISDDEVIESMCFPGRKENGFRKAALLILPEKPPSITGRWQIH